MAWARAACSSTGGPASKVSSSELVYDFFEDHVRAAAAVRERTPLALGVTCFAFGALALFVAQASAGRLFLGFSWISLCLMIVWDLLSGFLLAAVLHLILAMGRTQGSAAGLFVLFGMANLVWVLAVPLVLIVKALAPDSGTALTVVFLALGLLGFALRARSVGDNYQISLGRAWATLSLPYVGAAAGVLILLSLAMVGLFLELMKALR